MKSYHIIQLTSNGSFWWIKPEYAVILKGLLLHRKYFWVFKEDPDPDPDSLLSIRPLLQSLSVDYDIQTNLQLIGWIFILDEHLYVFF